MRHRTRRSHAWRAPATRIWGVRAAGAATAGLAVGPHLEAVGEAPRPRREDGRVGAVARVRARAVGRVGRVGRRRADGDVGEARLRAVGGALVLAHLKLLVMVLEQRIRPLLAVAERDVERGEGGRLRDVGEAVDAKPHEPVRVDAAARLHLRLRVEVRRRERGVPLLREDDEGGQLHARRHARDDRLGGHREAHRLGRVDVERRRRRHVHREPRVRVALDAAVRLEQRADLRVPPARRGCVAHDGGEQPRRRHVARRDVRHPRVAQKLDVQARRLAAHARLRHRACERAARNDGAAGTRPNDKQPTARRVGGRRDQPARQHHIERLGSRDLVSGVLRQREQQRRVREPLEVALLPRRAHHAVPPKRLRLLRRERVEQRARRPLVVAHLGGPEVVDERDLELCRRG